MKRILLIAAGLMSLAFTPAFAADSLRLCSGGETGVYYAAGDTIKTMAGNTLSITNNSSGGTLDNLDRVLDVAPADARACDFMIGQPDGATLIARQSPAKVKKLRKIADLHREYLHVLCGKNSGVDDLSDLADDPKKFSVDVGEPGSGAWLVWQNILAEDNSYAEIPVKNEGGILALSSVAAGDTTCMLVPAGLGNGTVREADNTFGDSVKLVGANDKDFNDATDIKGDPLYTYVDIPSGTYPQSLQTGFFGSKISTISWNAAVYVSTDRIDNAKLPKLIQVVSRAANGIRAEFGK